jgi:hypothetical protein
MSKQTSLPPVSRFKAKETLAEPQDLAGLNRSALREILESKFETSLTMSESSLSQFDGKRGWDLSWYEENHFTLFVSMNMEPVDMRAAGTDFAFSKDTIEAQIQHALESEMAKTKSLDGCFISIKANQSKPAIKFLQIPVKIAMTIDGHDRASIITLEACPPDSKGAPSKEEMKTSVLTLSCRFPVTYRESYRRPDDTQRFWVCSFKEDNPIDDILFTAVDFQIQFNEEKVDKQSLVAWKIIHAWFLEHHKHDMNDQELFSRRMMAGKLTVAKLEQRVTQPRFYITYNSPNFESQTALIETLGILHNTITRIPPKSNSLCPNGFEFKFYCLFFDPKNKAPRPLSLKPVIQRVHDKIHSQITPESALRLLFQQQSNFNSGLSSEEIQGAKIPTAETAIATLLQQGFLVQSKSAADRYVINPTQRPWKELRIYLNNQSIFAVNHKDCGIWIDQSSGLASDLPPLSMKCFALHVATAYSAITREHVSPAQLEEFMQYRYNHFKILLGHLEQNEHALQLLQQKHASDLEKSKDSRIDPDFIANPAFWSDIQLIRELSECVGNSSNSCMWSFLFLPTEFHQFNYLIISSTPHLDPGGHPSVKLCQPTYHFISEKPKAATISLMYQGGQNGHLTSLLIPTFKFSDFRKAALAENNNCFQIRFLKGKAQFWKPIEQIFFDVSLAAFASKTAPKINICLPSTSVTSESAAAATTNVVTDDAHEGDNGAGAAAGDANVTARGKDKKDRKKPSKAEKIAVKVRSAITNIETLCDQADGLSLTTHNSHLDAAKLLAQITPICDQLQEIPSSLQSGDLDLLEKSNAEGESLIRSFYLMTRRIDTVLELREKLTTASAPPSSAKASSTPHRKGGRGAGKNASKATQPPSMTMDFMLRIKSDFAADDVSENINNNCLLSLFHITPTPTSLVSFYHSLIHASSHETVKDEMETIFDMVLEPSKQLASRIQQTTRAAFDKVRSKPMVKGGRTFEEYLEYKNASSWNVIPNDHVLGEMSLCCQVWKLNVALIWKRNGVWRLFVLTHGGASPVICLLYARTRVILQSDSQLEFQCSDVCRFFPLHPLNDDWFSNELFIAAIPCSMQEGEEPEPIATFNAAVDKEFRFQSEVAVDGAASSDESSVITADLSASQLMDSFVDDEDMSQGPLPIPPEIAAIPLPLIASTINSAMARPLHEIVRRRRRIVTSDDEDQQAPGDGASNRA